MKTNRLGLNPFHLLALVPVVFFFLGIPDILARIADVNTLAMFGVGAVTSVFSLILAGQLKSGLWGGYIRLITITVWLSTDLSITLLMVIVSSIVGVILSLRNHPELHNNIVSDILGRITITGISLIATHYIYIALAPEAIIPIINHAPYFHLFPIVLALFMNTVITFTIGTLITGIPLRDRFNWLKQEIILETLLLFVAITLAVVRVVVGWEAFFVLIGLTGAQALRHWQLRQAQSKLSQRFNEIERLNALGRTVSTHLELDVTLDSIHQELQQMVEATTYFIALYNDDQQTVEYPLVYQNNKSVNWQRHLLGHGLVDYAIRNKRPVVFNREDSQQAFLKDVDLTTIKDSSNVIVPLIVGDKVIGAIGISHANQSHAFNENDLTLIQTISNQASLALRNASLYRRTVNLATNLTLINRSLQDVMFNLDRQDALATACRIARQVTNSHKSAIFLLQRNHDNILELTQSVGFETLEFVKTMPFEHAWHGAGTQVIPDVRALPLPALQAQAEKGQFKACIKVPLRSGSMIIGSLEVYHNEVHYYDMPEISMIEMLANQITAALDNADLLQALELYAAEQAQLVHLSRISSESLDLERIVDDVCEMLSQMINLPHIQIGMLDQETLHFQAQGNLKAGSLVANTVPEFNSLLMHGHATFTPLSYYLDKEQILSAGLRDFMKQASLAMILVMPLRINQQSIGLILLGDQQSRPLTDTEYRLLEMASHQIAAQIHNARIHTITEAALVQRLEQIGLIEVIAQQISQVLDLNVIIDNMLEAALQATQAELAAIAMTKTDGSNEFEVIWKEVHGADVIPTRVSIPIGAGTVGRVMRTGETLIIPDNLNYPHYLPPPNAKQVFRSSLAVPLYKGDQVIGVLNVESLKPNYFTDEQATFVKSLAGHASISIENANLLEERERQINTLTLLRTLSLETLGMIERENIATAILRTAVVLMDAAESAIFTVERDEDRTRFIAGVTIRGETLARSEPVIPEMLLQVVIQSGAMHMIEDTAQSDLYRHLSENGSVKHRSIVAIPIRRRNTISEVLCIGFANPRHFRQNDLNTLDLLAVQAASHLENAALNSTIRTSVNRMRAILNSTRDGIIMLDQAGRVQEVNRAAEALLNVPISDFLQHRLVDIVRQSSLDKNVRMLFAAYESDPESVNDYELTIVRDDGTKSLKSLVYTVDETSGSSIGYLLILRDITEEKNLEQFREKIQSMVLHDLRGPLGAIISSMYLAQSIVEFPGDMPLSETLTPTLDVTLESANNLLQMVDTMRDLPSLAQMHISPSYADLDDLAHKAFNALSATLKEANITVTINIPRALMDIYVDSDLIRRVFVNLMHNAFKFTPENGEILITADTTNVPDGFIRVRLSDTGPGIPEDQRERIFKEFVQIEGRKPRAGGKGMGLGLNFCKLAVEAHGGRIWVEAEGPLSGACFAFTLPISQEALKSRDQKTLKM